MFKSLFNRGYLTLISHPCPTGLSAFNQIRNARIWKTWPNDWLPFQWKKPELLPGYFESGDRKEGLDNIDLDQIKPNLQNLDSLERAPESVKRMFTLRFGRRGDIKQMQNEKYEKSLPIRRRPLDRDGYERKIIRLTSTIRHLRDIIRNEAPNSAGHKICCTRYINKRYKFLVELHKMDRETCIMLSTKLDIDFKPPVPYHWPYPFPERKRSIRETCARYCNDLKEKKLNDYKEKLKQEQAKFSEEKEQTLKWINETMAEFKITEEMLQEKQSPLYVFNSKYEFLE